LFSRRGIVYLIRNSNDRQVIDWVSFRQLAEDPCLFDEGRRILTLGSMKPMVKQAGRNVILGTKGAQ
jgi:hypothetical protein